MRASTPRTVLEDQEISFARQARLDPLGVVVMEEHPVAVGGHVAICVVAGRFPER